jgi:aspartate racemase
VNKKKIGIIGGVGPQSTSFIYEKIIYFSQLKYKAKNNADYPRLVIESVPVPDFISNKNDIKKAKEMLIDTVKSLSRSGATRLCIGSNTVHILLNELKKYTRIPFISMVDLVMDKCVKNKFEKVGIFGTPTLINSNLYPKKLEKNSIKAVSPSSEQIKIIEKIIRGIIAGRLNNVLKASYAEIINDFYRDGCDAIILGCTELPLVMDYRKFGKKIISSDEVLAEGLVDYYYL